MYQKLQRIGGRQSCNGAQKFKKRNGDNWFKQVIESFNGFVCFTQCNQELSFPMRNALILFELFSIM